MIFLTTVIVNYVNLITTNTFCQSLGASLSQGSAVERMLTEVKKVVS